MSSPKETNLSVPERDALRALHATWPLTILPDAAKPYAELVRITKPAGIFMFYLPCLYGTLLVGLLHRDLPFPHLLAVNARLFLFSFLLRSAACTWNDLLDLDLDRRVTRTRIRPLARSAVSIPAATAFLLAQLPFVIASFRSLSLTPISPPSPHAFSCGFVAAPFLALHFVYPFAKRATHHPQLLLGIANSCGIFLAFPASLLGKPSSSSSPSWVEDPVARSAALGLACANVGYTLLNDTVYAAQDLQDDKVAGIGSTMVYWERHARDFLRALAGVTIAALGSVAWALRGHVEGSANVAYGVLTCGGAAVGLGLMVEKVRLGDPDSCGWWFNRGNVWVGWAMASGLVAAYAIQVFAH